jgi:hypothetical protein
MIAWIIIIGILVLAFGTKALAKLAHRKFAKHHPNLSTRKRRLRFVNRFRHLEGVGD